MPAALAAVPALPEHGDRSTLTREQKRLMKGLDPRQLACQTSFFHAFTIDEVHDDVRDAAKRCEVGPGAVTG